MKATIDIPDELYRQVKAKSALEGRPLRYVAIDLFQAWLGQKPAGPSSAEAVTEAELEACPWLRVTQKYMRNDVSHAMEDIRQSIEKGWRADA
jgi:hypothetical protein